MAPVAPTLYYKLRSFYIDFCCSVIISNAIIMNLDVAYDENFEKRGGCRQLQAKMRRRETSKCMCKQQT